MKMISGFWTFGIMSPSLKKHEKTFLSLTEYLCEKMIFGFQLSWVDVGDKRGAWQCQLCLQALSSEAPFILSNYKRLDLLNTLIHKYGFVLVWQQEATREDQKGAEKVLDLEQNPLLSCPLSPELFPNVRSRCHSQPAETRWKVMCPFFCCFFFSCADRLAHFCSRCRDAPRS